MDYMALVIIGCAIVTFIPRLIPALFIDKLDFSPKVEKFLNLMLKTGEMAADVGSVIYGEEAVSLGLIDRIGTLRDALDCLYEQIGKRRSEDGK